MGRPVVNIHPSLWDASGIKPQSRYCSFDYCYHYFKSRSDKPKTLLNDMEKSCLTLGFFMASWGMMRGSGFLIEKSVKHYQPLIEYIAGLNSSTWKIDADSYTAENKAVILGIYQNIKDIFIPNGHAHLIMITKIMLGVFGFIPAFDKFFTSTFRGIFQQPAFRSLNDESLGKISEFYQANRAEIDYLHDSIIVRDFFGNPTSIKYPKAKIIDMYGFTKSQPQEN